MSGSWVSLPEMNNDIPTTIVSPEVLGKFEQELKSDGKKIIARNAIARNDMTSVLINRDLALETYHTYSDRLETEAKVTNQKASGRCWLFAAMNILRLDIMKKYKLEDFEFSQAYLFWYDKLEKSNWFLENIISTVDEELDGRLVQFLLNDPVQDGGQWDMAVNLIQKYGLVPKSVFPESAHSGNSRQMNWLITVKLREYALRLRTMHKEGEPIVKLRSEKEKMLKEVYNILSITLGQPPTTFDWNFRDKDKKFVSFKNLTPLSFYGTHVAEKVEDLVSLIHDPRHDYGKLYTVEYLGNVVGGRPVLYVNLEIEELKKYTIAAIQSGKSVWFGCDVGKFCARQVGVLDLDLFDYKNSYGLEFGLDKANRLRYGESLMTHAMAISGVHLEDGGKPIRWRIENSWGEDNGEKGYFSMTDSWFEEYVYQVVISKDSLSKEQQDITNQKAITLPPWDPLGALA